MASPLQALVILALSASCAQLAAAAVSSRVLIITEPGYDVNATTNVLDAANVPYTLLRVEPSNADQLVENSSFWQDGANGAFGGIFMQPDVEGDGSLNRSQVLGIWNYASTNGVRMVKTASWPSNHGMKAGTVNCDFDCTVAYQEARFTSAAVNTPFFNNTGLAADAKLNMTGLYRCATAGPSGWCGIWANDFKDDGLGGVCNITTYVETAPIATSNNTSNVSTVWVASTHDGREVMAVAHDCGPWSSACIAITKYQVAWMAAPHVALRRRYRRALLVNEETGNGTTPAPSPTPSPPSSCANATDDSMCTTLAAVSCGLKGTAGPNSPFAGAPYNDNGMGSPSPSPNSPQTPPSTTGAASSLAHNAALSVLMAGVLGAVLLL